ncbi:UDP-N-acetylmuramate dehydrogenase [Algoriphagus lutimaris]|uniref:UDP-N-acetylmuramate dehydrogenase n=1 Tax=Algoriphagus lutimaris TaxID=613197 RepID=UPI00196B098C|nr:UDP-N-acetylmuramate dehydrogenase [Algoriphagus lutimaris]MBN3519063.1 UDP-N-acetylmuramate dehydrogenase [Algoriphagus lutimaris]
MNIQENISLKPFNTFGLDKKARFFTSVNSREQLIESLIWSRNRGLEVFILGGGSNILLTQNINSLVIKIEISGIEVVNEDDDHVWVKVGAGENWHSFVLYAISQGWAGIENLSLIPGTVGASPMQNIGAYGVEIKDVFHSLRALNRANLEQKEFTKEECKFGYRESVFKNELQGQYIITSVTYQLNKKPKFNIEYGTIQETLKESGNEELSIQAISDAVIKIRQSKLPDPKEIGNAGSFFKNPTISEEEWDALKETFTDIPGYDVPEGKKVPAAWLIEKSGWKGKRFGETGVHTKQPLVLVNYGESKGSDIKELAENIQSSVYDKFGIQLKAEVNFI